jgi:hypothetical protein
MNTFLPPIEKPQGLMLKLAYYFTRKQFGKVLTPLKVHSARLPSAFGLFYAKVGKLDKKLTLPPETVLLIRETVARIDVCLFCMDIGRSVIPSDWRRPARRPGAAQRRTSRSSAGPAARPPAVAARTADPGASTAAGLPTARGGRTSTTPS